MTALPALPDRPTLKKSIVLLLMVPALAFALSLGNDFVEWDDPGLITENPISHGLTIENIKASFTSYDPELYIPHTFFSYQVDYTIGGLHPVVYHVHNLLFHLINVLLVAWLIYLLTGNRLAAMLGGLLFAVHPLQVETVVWASARKDLLSTTWFLGAIIAWLYARDRRSLPLYLFSICAFVMGLTGKVMIITLPIILLLILWRDQRKITIKNIGWLMPFVILSLGFGAIALLGKQAFVANASILKTILLGGKATFFLLWKFFLPTGLSVLYPYTDPVTFGSWDLTASLFAVIALTLGAFVAGWRWKRDILFGWLWFLICLSPTFLLYRKGEHLGDIYFTSDRYFYVSGIGLILIASLAATALIRKYGKQMQTACGVVIGLLVLMSMYLSLAWRDTDTLFLRVLRLYPNSHIAHLTVGNMYQRQGDLEQAFTHYQKALEIRPTSLTYFNLGNALLTINKPDEAIEANKRALALDPALAIAEVNMGVGYVKKKMFTEATEAFRRALILDPYSREAAFNLKAMQNQTP